MDEYTAGSVCDTIKSTSKKKNTKLLKLFSTDFSVPEIDIKKIEEEKIVIEEKLIETKRKNVEEEENRTKRTIFIGNLNKQVEKKNLKSLFSPFGNIESIRLRSAAPNDPKLPKKAIVIKKLYNEKKDTLNAYIVFKEEESVEKSLSLNGTEFLGLHIRVDCGIHNKEHDHKKSIFVGNLSFDEKEENLRKLFSACGDIDNIRLIRDKNTGMGKGFGYVLFKEVSSVSLAMSLNNKKISNREIRIQISTSKPKPLMVKKRPLDQLKSEGEIKKRKFMGDINKKEFDKSRVKSRENRKKYKSVVKTSFGKTKSKRVKKSKKKES